MRGGTLAPLSKALEASSVEVARMGDPMTPSITGMETSSVSKVSLVECLLPFFFASCQMHALYSLGSSWVTKDVQVLSWKSLSFTLIEAVTPLKISRVKSWCIQSLARPCQWAATKRRSRILVLWGSGSRPSKTGIKHCTHSAIQLRIRVTYHALATGSWNHALSVFSAQTY